MNDSGTYNRRRTSISDATTTPRTTPYKQSNLSYGQYRSPAGYNSSPLAPRSDHTLRAEPTQQSFDYGQGVEGTESTASTTGPSTVWDELDDLKSRINRLEVTGKTPSTSGAAMSRVSDERPYTANTALTNISGSPKRTATGRAVAAANAASAHPDAMSTVSGPKESHPNLHAALAKSKALLGAEVYKALESAATDALGLLNMMGTVGQPGPISSGASTIGGPGMTDRQLRRKADSVCRSITELCLALNEENARPKTSHGANANQNDCPSTPTTLNGFTALNPQRRASTMTDQRPNTSPRAMSRLEERRTNLLNGTALPSPRLAMPSFGATAEVGAQGRRSSLLLSRRRAGTEEPDEGRTSSLLLRTRRAGTEEPDEARKASLLTRPRRGTIGEDEEDSRLRAPSRAATELAPLPVSSRAISRDYSAPGGDASLMTSTALPRRRLGPSSLTSRLAVPASPSTTTTGRRFGGDGNTNNVADKLAEERAPRFSLGQTLLGRTTSLSRRARDSVMMNSPTTPQAGTYR